MGCAKFDHIVCADKDCTKTLKGQGYTVHKTVRAAIHEIMGELYPEVTGGPRFVVIHPNAHDEYDPKLVIPKGLKVKFLRPSKHNQHRSNP